MAQYYNIPGQNLTYKLPEVGEVFIDSSSRGVYKRTSTGIVGFDSAGMGPGVHRPEGIDVNSLETYLLPDVQAGLQQLGAYTGGSSAVKDSAFFTPTPITPTNEIFTQTSRPDN